MHPVQHTPEVDRIAALPRRRWTAPQAEALASRLSAALRTPSGRQGLRKLQAIALAEIASWGGAFIPIPVGGGKTLVSLLAPRLLDDVLRPLILMPAHLIEKTEHEARGYRADWALPPLWRIESYQTLSRVGAADFLDSYAPDFIFCDEAQWLKNPKAAVTRRVGRYVRDRRGSGRPLVFCAATGSPMGKSIRDFAHLLNWCLPRSNPAPEVWSVLDEWARALDVEVHPVKRMSAGALLRLEAEPPANPWFMDDTVRARLAFQSRLKETPGVIMADAEQLPIPLRIRSHVIDLDTIQTEAFENLRATWTTPDGIQAEDGASVWRHARELAVGWYQVWDPRPPDDWRDARRGWATECRETLSENRRGIDSAEQLKQALDASPEWYPHAAQALAAWRAAEPAFLPNPRPVWITDHTLRAVAKWAAESPGLIWTDRPEVGRKLAELTGIPYYGAEGVDALTGRSVTVHPQGVGSIILARKANDSGRNLQGWNRNLVIDVPASAIDWEQLIGRTHREGQRAGIVTVDVLVGCVEDVIALWKANERAIGVQDTTGLPQKLCHADLDGFVTLEEAGAWPGPQWRKTK